MKQNKVIEGWERTGCLGMWKLQLQQFYLLHEALKKKNEYGYNLKENIEFIC